MMHLFALNKLKAVSATGSMLQQDRIYAIEQFQQGQTNFLLTTDLLARGIDICSVKTVINFNFPNEPKRYLHRIGRTARAGQSGVALTICNDEERKELKKVSRKMNT